MKRSSRSPAPVPPPAPAKTGHRPSLGRNLKIAVVCLALYYLVSAGYGLYTQSALPRIDPALAAGETLTQPSVFLVNYNTCLGVMGSSLAAARAEDHSGGYTAHLAEQLEMHGEIRADGMLQQVQVQSRYRGALPAAALEAIRALVGTCENTANEDYINYFMRGLGIHPAPGMNESGKVFEARRVRNDSGLQYQVSFEPGSDSVLTVSVTRTAAD